jgi:hypothetical protein
MQRWSSPHNPRPPRRPRSLRWASVLCFAAAIVAVLSVAPAEASWSGGSGPSYQWSNGNVLCIFNASLPSVTVSASGRADSGLVAGLGQITELAPNGAVVARAATSAVAWDPSINSSATTFVMSYSQTIPVSSASSPAQNLGSVLVALNFGLPRSASTSLADQVSVALSITHWPWQNTTSDTLALILPLWPAVASSEHLVLASPNATRIDSVSSVSGQTLEYFQAGSWAQGPSGSSISVSALTTLSGGVASTILLLGPGAGGATTLTYQATIGILPGTSVLGLPLYDYLLVAGSAGLVTLVIGLGTRQLRRRPSKLTYVEESE